MRQETRKYLCSELRDYQQSLIELRKINEKLSMLQYPAYHDYYGSKNIQYMEVRQVMLSCITNAIYVLNKELDDEDNKLLYLKFWSPKPRMTDIQIAIKMHLSRSQYYRRINNICLKLGRKLGTDL